MNLGIGQIISKDITGPHLPNALEGSRMRKSLHRKKKKKIRLESAVRPSSNRSSCSSSLCFIMKSNIVSKQRKPDNDRAKLLGMRRITELPWADELHF